MGISSELSTPQNDYRKILFSLLKSKDDNIILMMTSLLQSILENQSISREVLNFCGLLSFHTEKSLSSDAYSQNSMIEL